jgi:hypothetical protein
VETKLVIYGWKIHYFNIARFNGKFILFLGKDDESSRWKILNFCFLMENSISGNYGFSFFFFKNAGNNWNIFSSSSLKKTKKINL